MHSIFMRLQHQCIDSSYSLFVNLVDVFRCDIFISVNIKISRIGHRYSHKIKAPVPHPFKVIFNSSWSCISGIGRKKIKEIKSSPLRNFVFLWDRQDFRRKTYGSSRYTRSGNKRSSVHGLNFLVNTNLSRKRRKQGVASSTALKKYPFFL